MRRRRGVEATAKGFVIEKAMGSGTLSGQNLKLAGYSIHMMLDLKTSSALSPADAQLEPNVALWDKQMNLLTVLVHDKAIILRQDAITVSM